MIKINSNQMEDQIDKVLHWSNQKEPEQEKKMKSSGGILIGFTFQLLLLNPQTHPGTAK